jgi:hypothetical protein
MDDLERKPPTLEHAKPRKRTTAESIRGMIIWASPCALNSILAISLRAWPSLGERTDLGAFIDLSMVGVLLIGLVVALSGGIYFLTKPKSAGVCALYALFVLTVLLDILEFASVGMG